MVMIASLLACATTTTGIFIISKYKKIGLKYVNYFMFFAAGVLISVSFIHIVPKSFEMSKAAPIALLAGFLLLYLIDELIRGHTGAASKRSLGIIATLGIGLHSFIDGIIYSVTFSVNILTGVVAAIGMVLHEFPEGIITFLLLIKGGFKKIKSTWYAFLAAAISTPLGALISYPFISTLKGPILGFMLALSAGVLIYVGASRLLPEAEKEHKKYSLLALAAGILIAILIILSKA